MIVSSPRAMNRSLFFFDFLCSFHFLFIYRNLLVRADQSFDIVIYVSITCFFLQTFTHWSVDLPWTNHKHFDLIAFHFWLFASNVFFYDHVRRHVVGMINIIFRNIEAQRLNHTLSGIDTKFLSTYWRLLHMSDIRKFQKRTEIKKKNYRHVELQKFCWHCRVTSMSLPLRFYRMVERKLTSPIYSSVCADNTMFN